MKMSDYILEQDISSASVMDIELAQSYAEMSVATALMECYLKQEAIMEYASCDASEFGVFMEADEDAQLTVSQKNTPSVAYDDIADPKKETEVSKKWWQKLLDWFKNVIKAIRMTFAKKSPKKCLYYLEKCPDGTAFDFPLSQKYVCEKYSEIIRYAAEACDALENKSTQPSAYDAITAKIEDTLNYMNDKHEVGSKVHIGKDQIRDVMVALDSLELSKKLETMSKKLDDLKKTDFVPVTGDNKSDAAKAAKKKVVESATKMVKTACAGITELNKTVIDIWDKVIKTTYKESKKKKKD